MKIKNKILVVEDDDYINKLLCDMLKDSGYITKSAYSGTEALIYLKEDFDMVILDLMLPGISGEKVLEEIRKIKSIPIIIISAKEDKGIKIKTLRMGVDDYITKPFDMEEVSARIDSNLRRYKELSQNNNTNNNVTKYKEITVNEDTREVFVNKIKVELTMREFDILFLLVNNPKKVFSKSNIFESVWNEEFLAYDNTINVHVSNLRNKLLAAGVNKDYIKTVWGIGYKLDS
ncbi:response regulator transcription factor [Clostridium oceanicum]|uniref:Stage 0 sporulation protein A homolog n=1 Tax=Clostridium oceanicum TaxID=1543 RepID=A0ABN1JEM7_9CLOT